MPVTRPTDNLLRCACACVVVLTARPAAADDPALAEQLFREGKAAMQAGDVNAACEKFEASRGYDLQATGTLLNLALCHEAQGKVATAWAEFRAVVAESAERREDRVVMAREHETKLFPRLSYVIVAVRPSARVEGLVLTLDKKRPLLAAAWGSELPIDPGHHVLDVEAAGMRSMRYEFDVLSKPGDQTIDVMPLVIAPRPASADDLVARENAARLHRRRTIGFVLVGAGAVSAAVGGVFGGRAIDEYSGVKHGKYCPSDNTCPTPAAQRSAQDAYNASKTYALVSDVTIGVGAALAVAGVVLVVTSSPKPSSTASTATAATSVRLAGTRTGGGVLLEGSF